MDILELTGFPNRPCLWSLHAPLSSSSFLSLLPIVLAGIQTEIDELSNQALERELKEFELTNSFLGQGSM